MTLEEIEKQLIEEDQRRTLWIDIFTNYLYENNSVTLSAKKADDSIKAYDNFFENKNE